MSFFHIWMITVVVSLFMQIKNKLEMYKDAADAGYILNSKKLEMLNDEINKAIIEDKEIDVLSKIMINYGIFIPFYNLLAAVLREDDYYKQTKEFIEELKEAGVLEAMTTAEKEEYNKKKTGFNAIKIEKKKWLRLSKANYIFFENEGAIWFDYKDGFEDDIDNFKDSIIILYAEGEVSNLSHEEQKTLVYNSHISVAEAILNSNDNPDPLIENNTKTKDNIKTDIDEFKVIPKEETSVHKEKEEETNLDTKQTKHITRVKKR